jgi:hypothetical protein
MDQHYTSLGDFHVNSSRSHDGDYYYYISGGMKTILIRTTARDFQISIETTCSEILFHYLVEMWRYGELPIINKKEITHEGNNQEA